VSLSRSIPVSTPIAPRQWTRSSLETFPEAPGAKGHPPRPPMEESKCVTPHSIAARMFGIAIARVSCVWSVHSTPGKRAIRWSRTRATWRGLAMPVVSARPTARADVHEAADDALEVRQGDVALEGAAEGGRDAAAHVHL